MQGKIFLSLFDKTLEISLYRVLQNAIGRYLETLIGLLTFGMRVIKVRFIEGGIEPVLSHVRITSATSSPITNQNCWKNNGGISSGPRDFRGSI